ncbi:hypothetical protein ACPB8Q_02885 [Methanocaldococcus indicus]|uniref:hypothetical protein n=1 Tax=Methanocaldococcus indicus TaxID=213231 RepID=UPI003C6D6CB6
MRENIKMYDLDDKELIIPPGIPESVIARVVEMCNVRFDVKEDEINNTKYMVLVGKEENLEKAKKLLSIITELKLLLRDLARMGRRHKLKVNIYVDDENIRYILSKIINDVANKEYLNLAEELPDDYEIIKIKDIPIYVF